MSKKGYNKNVKKRDCTIKKEDAIVAKCRRLVKYQILMLPLTELDENFRIF